MNISEIIASQKDFFHKNRTKSISFRKEMLVRLRETLKSNEKELNEAIYKDLRKSEFETYATELGIVYGEINIALKKLVKWSRPGRKRTNLANFPGKSYLIPEPYGCCLIIGTWNYPYQMTLAPLVPCIATGNTAIIKPSETGQNTSALLARIINNAFPPEYIHVYEGGVEETTRLLEEKFDKFFFTGGAKVGKIVMAAAARHLTPFTLELGGKSPCFVFADANLEMSARRIAWGKFLNAGQTCVAPDYLLVESSVTEKFLPLLTREIEKIQGDDPSTSEAYLNIASAVHFDRLEKLIDREKLYYGGVTDRSKLYISPTILKNADFSDPVMQDEIFGPVLPVIEFDDIDMIINKVKSFSKPLSLYIFTRDKAREKKLLHEISFGGGCVNDTVMHFTNPHLPFGGVGFSGMGAYHGVYGFREFSHYKSILKKPYWFEPFMKYPPYNGFKKKLLKLFLEKL